MPDVMWNALIALPFVLAMAGTAGAQEDKVDDAQPAADQPAFKSNSVTQHEAAGVKFEARAAELDMKDDAGVTRGTIFFVYYAATGDDGKPLHETQPRPITYVFNGGPGAASVWLHLGTAGPFRVDLPDDGTPPQPPSVVVKNESSWLAATDLVFIDPIGTGFSRAATKKEDKDKDGKQDQDADVKDEGERFYGVEQDTKWVGEFIRLHCTRFGRWDDKKFLAGESYGTTRAARLAIDLHDRFGFDVSGVILISTVLDFSTIREAANNPMPLVSFLPTYAATAAFHGKIDMAPDEARRAAAEFAVERYLPALVRGRSLDEAARRNVAEEYAKLTGLDADYVMMNDLRVGPFRFMKQLLADERQVVGRMDGRLTGHDRDPAAAEPDSDPSLGGYYGLYAGAFNDYIRGRLGFESDLAYEVLSSRTRPWKPTADSANSYSGGYLNVADDLERALNEIPGLRLLVASGIYDLATPWYGADYTVDQFDVPPEVRERIVQTYYEGGHMMYHVADERKQIGEDVRSFIAGEGE